MHDRHHVLKSEDFVSYCGVPLIARGEVEGVLEIFQRGELNPDESWLEYLTAIADQAAIAVDNARLFENLQRSHGDLTRACDATLESWVKALDLRDKETEGHTRRVVDLTLRLGEAMGAHGGALVHLRRVALLHDIGKLGIPHHIVLEAAKLTLLSSRSSFLFSRSQTSMNPMSLCVDCGRTTSQVGGRASIVMKGDQYVVRHLA